MSYTYHPNNKAGTTPISDTEGATVHVSYCNLLVPPAPEKVIGLCTYYYRPLHQEYVDKSGVSTGKAISSPIAVTEVIYQPLKKMVSWASGWDPWKDTEVAKQLLRNRTALIKANPDTPDWSRHANFMMRHTGCHHKPPDYYVSYGYFYCSRYGKYLYPTLSDQGKQWLANARKNLQRNMESALKQNMAGGVIKIVCKVDHRRDYTSKPIAQYQLEIKNDTFRQVAFGTHVPAYLDAGLAELSVADMAKITGQPDIGEWGKSDTWKQAEGAAVGVAEIRSAEALKKTLTFLRSVLK